MKKINMGSVGVILAGFAAIIVTALFVTGFFGDPITCQNTDALIILATVFSVFAGFIIAITAVLGDPGILYSGSWRIASAHRRQLRRSLQRQAVLLYVYLSVLGLTFAAALLGNVESCSVIADWFTRIALSLGAGAFIWSFALPVSIFRANLNRLDEGVEARRRPGNSDPERR